MFARLSPHTHTHTHAHAQRTQLIHRRCHRVFLNAVCRGRSESPGDTPMHEANGQQWKHVACRRRPFDAATRIDKENALPLNFQAHRRASCARAVGGAPPATIQQNGDRTPATRCPRRVDVRCAIRLEGVQLTLAKAKLRHLVGRWRRYENRTIIFPLEKIAAADASPSYGGVNV